MGPNYDSRTNHHVEESNGKLCSAPSKSVSISCSMNSASDFAPMRHDRRSLFFHHYIACLH